MHYVECENDGYTNPLVLFRQRAVELHLHLGPTCMHWRPHRQYLRAQSPLRFVTCKPRFLMNLVPDPGRKGIPQKVTRLACQNAFIKPKHCASNALEATRLRSGKENDQISCFELWHLCSICHDLQWKHDIHAVVTLAVIRIVHWTDSITMS
jgi:hypothetical protein